MNWAVGLTFAATIVLVRAEWRHSRIRYLAKPLASAGFVTVGILALDLDSIYGVTILTGLMLGAAGDVALMECELKGTGEQVAVVVAANRADDGEIDFVPFAMLFNGNPYNMLNPPNPDGGFHDSE